MTTTLRTTRAATAVFGAVLALALSLGTGAAAYAANDDDSVVNNDVGVSVPAPAPKPQPPYTPPPFTPPKPNTNTGSKANTGTTATDPATPGAGTPTEPKIPNSPATTGAEAHVDRRDQTYRAGDKITVTADGFTAGEQVQIVLFSDPVLIGNVEAAANGKLSHTFTLADETETGKHTLQLTGWQSKRVAIASFLVVSDAAVAGDVVASAFVIPVWVWWVLGIVLAILAALGIWWIMRIMREQGHGSTYGHSAGGATA